jgi:gas vesicle protein
MSNKKFIQVAVLGLLVFAPLLLIDWVMIIHLISHVIPVGGFALYALSGVFIFTLSVLPVVGITPALTKRINNIRYCRWTNKKVEKDSNFGIGVGIIMFLAATVTFLTMSVSNPDRFIIGQGDPVADMFSAAVSDLITNVTDGGIENAVLAAWITGMEPFITTVISFVVYLLLCMDKKEDRLERDIQACRKKITQLNKEVDEISRDIEISDSERVLLDNISGYIDEIQHTINEFVAEKDAYMQRIKDEQRQEFNTAQKSVEKLCWTYLDKFYEHGKQKFELIRANGDAWKRITENWKNFYQELRESAASEMSNTCGSTQSYAAMITTSPHQKMKRGA